MENLDYYNAAINERPNIYKRVIHVLTFNTRRLLKRRFFIALVFFLIIFQFLTMFQTYSVIITNIKYKTRNYLYNHGWLPCSLRKEPILYMIDTQKLMAVWETNCILDNVRIQWYEKSIDNEINRSDILEPIEIDNSHYVYKGIIGPITSNGYYEFEIIHSLYTKIISSYFQFFPSIPDDPNSTYPIQIIAFADNQFGLSVFNRLVQSASQKTSPNFIIHAGDGVQEYNNLQQWQTDFYDPLANYKLTKHAPIIYAHGNHDFDPKNLYNYTTDTSWYSLTIANTRWIVLDSNIDDINQDLWLSNELSSPETQNKDFKIVIVHIPPFMEFWDPIAWNEKKEKHWGEFWTSTQLSTWTI
ncbi:uncharacterized protein OCT59_013240 [Rhizophagus irregularis]|uniref:uncharacterized protein n=1 Tax=Rhizophagus irregularis TaxID=588596 RepID=UPI00332CCA06|nr:hypothetical protein OCT59_013240 [Rhizophagus irregularis]